MKITEVLQNDQIGVPTPSLKDLVKKYNLPVEVLQKQLDKGIEVEKEHTQDPSLAMEIALDHLAEFPDYYDRLEKAEKE